LDLLEADAQSIRQHRFGHPLRLPCLSDTLTNLRINVTYRFLAACRVLQVPRKMAS